MNTTTARMACAVLRTCIALKAMDPRIHNATPLLVVVVGSRYFCWITAALGSLVTPPYGGWESWVRSVCWFHFLIYSTRFYALSYSSACETAGIRCYNVYCPENWQTFKLKYQLRTTVYGGECFNYILIIVPNYNSNNENITNVWVVLLGRCSYLSSK